MSPKVVVLSYNNYCLIMQDCPNRQYVVRNGQYIGSFLTGKFVMKKPFEWAPGYEPDKKELKKMTEDELPEHPTGEDIRILEIYFNVAVSTLFEMQSKIL